ncbi:PREDICTED: uncharacterized protein LOC104827368 [Tarenaya hassleriana]|uniref:uncharacterized protein LOC104827368 n=1 Tax=Tarenaya hassleriana TaxID=28532 RepID=UPI00053C32BF|nr:PREDICTED: uncharacterized protein LOC104827368 [Tarenaya hassleriana]
MVRPSLNKLSQHIFVMLLPQSRQNLTTHNNRKLKDNQEVGGHVVDLTGNTAKKQKRLRVSSSAGKESDGDSVNAVLDRRVSQASDKYCASHPDSMATASSSFKSFGSRKTKTNIQEAKGSPIGLSPLKMLDTDKGRRNHSEKDEYRDTKFRASSGVKRWSNGERDHHDQKKKLDELDGSSHYSGKLKTEPSFNKNRPYGENCTRDKSQWKDSGELLSIPTNKKNQDMVFISDLQDDATAGEVRSDKCRSKKTPLGKVSIESCKDDTRVCQNFNAISDANGSRYYASTQKPETTKTIPIVQGEMVSGKRKKKSVQPSGAGQVEVLGQGSDVLNTKTQIIGHGDNVAHDKCVRNSNPNGSKMKGHDDISSLKKGSTSQAVSNSIKEATDLKHMADRLKNAGSNRESTSFYFQAALKFLYGASLLESSSGHSKHKSSARSRQIYDSTAKLCKFCAREYEKYKDMGAAALAYKCMEVAYLRMIYSSRDSTSRYRYELQAALQVIPSGESLSSATDVKNLSHTSPAEKASSSYVVRSPKVTGNQFISSESHFYLSQLLAFSQNAISAMDASRKAQVALGAAKGKSVDVHYDSDGISSIKRALDFNFQDMEGLLLVVRLAMEAINR